MVLHEPDVALTDLALAVETGAFAAIMARFPSARRLLRARAALLFLFLSASSLGGAAYHGFFPLRTATVAGWTVWIFTMVAIGGAASMAWLISGALTRAAPRWLTPAVAVLLAAYLLFLLFVDYHFWVSIAVSIPPLLVLLGLFVWKARRDRSVAAAFGVAAILLMFAASALQQLHVGLHATYFNHNALYHLIQGIALALLFYACRLFLLERE